MDALPVVADAHQIMDALFQAAEEAVVNVRTVARVRADLNLGLLDGVEGESVRLEGLGEHAPGP